MATRTVELTVTSFRKQDVTLMARHGIEKITATPGVLAASLKTGNADIDVHLPENKPVSFQLKLGHRNSFDWVEQMARS